MDHQRCLVVLAAEVTVGGAEARVYTPENQGEGEEGTHCFAEHDGAGLDPEVLVEQQ